MTTSRFRIADNNFAELITSSITYSSAASSFPGANVVNKFRSKVWMPNGYFNITASNRNIFMNDGSDKTAQIAIAEYTSPSTLATAMAAALNVVGSNWSVSYSSTTYKFTISNTGSVTLRLSATTNAAWDDVGFTGSADRVGLTFLADVQRNHTEEFAVFDLTYQVPITFFACIGPLDEDFSISSDATIKIQANNMDIWTAPPLDQTLTRTDDGLMFFFDDVDDSAYRYWRFYIQDRENPLGNDGLSFGHIFLGDYVNFGRNISMGFNMKNVDPSTRNESESGAIFFDTKTKFHQYNGMSVQYMSKADRDSMRAVFNKLGTTTPFYFSIDPTELISDNQDFTRYVIFDNEPTFSHIIHDIFSMGMNVREVL